MRFQLARAYFGYQQAMAIFKGFSLLSNCCPLLIFNRQGTGEGGGCYPGSFSFSFFDHSHKIWNSLVSILLLVVGQKY